MLRSVLIGKLTLPIWLRGSFLQTAFDRAGVCVSAGEGYECTVTVDDEDSKILVFDNWKQVSELPVLPGLPICNSVLRIHGSDSNRSDVSTMVVIRGRAKT